MVHAFLIGPSGPWFAVFVLALIALVIGGIAAITLSVNTMVPWGQDAGVGCLVGIAPAAGWFWLLTLAGDQPVPIYLAVLFGIPAAFVASAIVVRRRRTRQRVADRARSSGRS